VLNARWPVLSGDESRAALPSVRKALETGETEYGGLQVTPDARVPVVPVAVPVPGGEWALAAPVSPSVLNGALREQKLPAGWIVTVFDLSGTVIGRSIDPGSAIGQQKASLLTTDLPRGGAQFLTDQQTLEGEPAVLALARAPVTGFYVSIAAPNAVFYAPLDAALLRMLAPGLVLLLGGAACGLWLRDRVVSALRAVSDMPSGSVLRTGLREVDELARALSRAEAAIREGAARYRALVHATSAVVWRFSANGMRPLSVEGVTGKADGNWLERIHPDDRPRSAAAWQHAIATGTPYEMELRHIGEDGRYRWFLSRGIPLHDQTGSVSEWIGVSSDIEARKQAETALRQLNADLVAAVNRALAARQAAQARAAQAERMQALGRIAGGIAHDVNNVLQAVASAAGGIERHLDEPEEVRRLTRLILEAEERGAAITGRLLGFARRGGALKQESLDVAALLNGLAEMLAHTLGAGIEAKVEAASDLPPISGDRGQLETVLLNLATNARDAMPSGGCLSLAAVSEIVGPEEGDLRPGRYVRVSVADTGHGMDAQTLAKVAEPFFTTKPEGRGTGLGLSMARSFAEQSGGALRIESAPGVGTKVSLWFPCSGVAVAAPVAPRPAAVPRGKGCGAHLILVDDDCLVRETLASELEDAGYRVVAFGDPAVALERLAAGRRADLLVSDLAMPGMDGIALIRAAREHVPVAALLLSGRVDDEGPGTVLPDRVRALQKPVTRAALINAIEDALVS
jgi:PAS domain S-box-containing protein